MNSLRALKADRKKSPKTSKYVDEASDRKRFSEDYQDSSPVQSLNGTATGFSGANNSVAATAGLAKRNFNFAEKLMDVLDDEEHNDAIRWNQEGDAFGLFPKKCSQVLNKHFQGTKLDSFRRKLSRWGFERIVDNSLNFKGAVVYMNESFKRGMPGLLRDMKYLSKTQPPTPRANAIASEARKSKQPSQVRSNATTGSPIDSNTPASRESAINKPNMEQTMPREPVARLGLAPSHHESLNSMSAYGHMLRTKVAAAAAATSVNHQNLVARAQLPTLSLLGAQQSRELDLQSLMSRAQAFGRIQQLADYQRASSMYQQRDDELAIARLQLMQSRRNSVALERALAEQHYSLLPGGQHVFSGVLPPESSLPASPYNLHHSLADLAATPSIPPASFLNESSFLGNINSGIIAATLQEPTPEDLHRRASLAASLDQKMPPVIGAGSNDSRKPPPGSSAGGEPMHEDESEEENTKLQRTYQDRVWFDNLKKLRHYREVHGHCVVPQQRSQKSPLARWVKRQRYQYKLMLEGKPSNITEDRVRALDDIGFVWDAHSATWSERVNELKAFRRAYKHCNVPATDKKNSQLASWVKSQRRQFKLFAEGKESTLTQDRIDILESLGFEWSRRSPRPS